ncbi:FeoB-associated Cys-rich membrane protein [Olivibacter ginsenosidimutans]|uniref:FeoB-associated Cys-rich membrane protein n=1 Tax=Olivibacter ginsenosidimutans TaxID=1176537 RepID=UPI0031EBBA77
MNVQLIIVFGLFAYAAFYIGRMLYRNLKPKKGKTCGSNCKCGVDFSDVQPTTQKAQ